MKYSIPILSVLFLSLMGCLYTNNEPEGPARYNYYSSTNPVLIISVDHETGCQYFTAEYYSGIPTGITPRLKSDGTQVCTKLEGEEEQK